VSGQTPVMAPEPVLTHLADSGMPHIASGLRASAMVEASGQPHSASSEGGSSASPVHCRGALGDLAASLLREVEAHLAAARRQAAALAELAAPAGAADAMPRSPGEKAEKARSLERRASASRSSTAWHGPSECDEDSPPPPAEFTSGPLLPDAAPALMPRQSEVSSFPMRSAPTGRQAKGKSASEEQIDTEVLPAWRAQPVHRCSVSSMSMASIKSKQMPFGGVGSGSFHPARKNTDGTHVVFQEMICTTSPIRHIVLHPSSWQRVLWDALSLLVVAYDVLTLPLLAFGFDHLKVAHVLRNLTTAFWTLDIFVTFITGFHKRGVIVCLPVEIAKRYLFRAFILDLGIVVVDWIMLSVEEGVSSSSSAVDIARLGKMFRVIRLLRILRLLRAIKFVDLSMKFGDLIMAVTVQSRSIFELLGIIRLMLLVVVANHFIACSWYALGEDAPLERSWLQQLDLEEDGMLYRYAVSFHWTMSQFTPAPNNFHPINMKERYFAIGVLLFGFTMVSSFLGSITSLLTHIRNSAVKRTEEDMRVREFLSQNNVSLQLGNRIITYLRQRQAETKKRILEEDARGFQDLPVSLRMELRFEVYYSLLETHPLMSAIAVRDQGFICSACDDVMSQKYLAKGHELFHVGTESRSVFASITSGLQYRWFTPLDEAVETAIAPDDWICEGALWMKWVHRGQATAKVACTVACLSADGFRVLAPRHPAVFELSRTYARLFVERLRRVRPEARLDTWTNVDVVEELTLQAVDIVEPVGHGTSEPSESLSERSIAKGLLGARATAMLQQARDIITRGGERSDEVRVFGRSKSMRSSASSLRSETVDGGPAARHGSF